MDCLNSDMEGADFTISWSYCGWAFQFVCISLWRVLRNRRKSRHGPSTGSPNADEQ